MRTKNIYFECGALVADHFSGVGHYVQGIAEAWDKYLAHPEHTVLQNKTKTRCVTYLFASKNRMKHLKKFRLEHMRHKAMILPARIIHKLLDSGRLLPLDLWVGRGTYLFTNFARYPLLRSKSATVIYDISFEVVPQYADANNARYLSNVVRSSVQKSDLIITISNYAKKELVEYYSIKPEKIIVAYPAVDKTRFYRRANWEIDKVKRKYELPDNYVLFVGNIEPRKNITTLIDAYTNLPNIISDKHPLLLVGANGWLSEEIFHKLEESKKRGYSIVRPNSYVDDADIPAVYSGAKMLVYPSHYEGFGMPPLEAMSCGVPVIAADNTSLPEVVGDAGMLVKSNDANAITESITKLASANDLRNQMIKKGYLQTKKFSWEHSAKKIYDALLEL